MSKLQDTSYLAEEEEKVKEYHGYEETRPLMTETDDDQIANENDDDNDSDQTEGSTIDNRSVYSDASSMSIVLNNKRSSYDSMVQRNHKQTSKLMYDKRASSFNEPLYENMPLSPILNMHSMVPSMDNMQFSWDPDRNEQSMSIASLSSMCFSEKMIIH